jgi:hypothetical protein
LAASVQRGSVGWLGEPLYPLLLKATQTIQTFLESIDSHDELQGSEKIVVEPVAFDFDDLFPLPSPDPWNLEISFWDNLAEHPFLSNTDPFSENPWQTWCGDQVTKAFIHADIPWKGAVFRAGSDSFKQLIGTHNAIVSNHMLLDYPATSGHKTATSITTLWTEEPNGSSSPESSGGIKAALDQTQI